MTSAIGEAVEKSASVGMAGALQGVDSVMHHIIDGWTSLTFG